MFATVAETLILFAKNTLDALGYTGIVVLMAIDGACFPIPSEFIMPFAGFLVAEGRFNIHAVAFAGAFGSLLGSIVIYALGFYGGRPLLERYGRYILIRKHELAMADRFFVRWGKWTVFISRMVPLVRTYISLPAGIARMEFRSFCILTFAGALLWSYALTWVGVRLGENWENIRDYTHLLDWIVGAALLLLIIFWLVRRFGKRAAVS